jgi:hypothetical protein
VAVAGDQFQIRNVPPKHASSHRPARALSSSLSRGNLPGAIRLRADARRLSFQRISGSRRLCANIAHQTFHDFTDGPEHLICLSNPASSAGSKIASKWSQELGKVIQGRGNIVQGGGCGD